MGIASLYINKDSGMKIGGIFKMSPIERSRSKSRKVDCITVVPLRLHPWISTM